MDPYKYYYESETDSEQDYHNIHDVNDNMHNMHILHNMKKENVDEYDDDDEYEDDQKYKKKLLASNKGQDDNYCDLCDKRYKTVRNMINHMNSKMHIKNLVKFNQGLIDQSKTNDNDDNDDNIKKTMKTKQKKEKTTNEIDNSLFADLDFANKMLSNINLEYHSE